MTGSSPSIMFFYNWHVPLSLDTVLEGHTFIMEFFKTQNKLLQNYLFTFSNDWIITNIEFQLVLTLSWSLVEDFLTPWKSAIWPWSDQRYKTL